MDLAALPTARVRSELGIIEATTDKKRRRRHWKENHVSYQLRPHQTDRRWRHRKKKQYHRSTERDFSEGPK